MGGLFKMLDLFEVSLILTGVFLFGVVFYKFVYLRYKAKTAGNAIRILLFEMVGKDMVFIGSYVGEEKPDDALGVYISIGKDQKVISDVANHDLFYDNKFGKCLMVCKYADDDFRAMARLRGEHWFKKTVRDEPVLDAQTGEPMVDKAGVPIVNSFEDYVAYHEPVGITQEGREVMRFNREWHKRMAERRSEKASFWDKYGGYVMMGSMLLIILMSTAYNSNKFAEASESMAGVFAEKSEEYIAKMESPSFIETLIQKVETRNTPSPPT